MEYEIIGDNSPDGRYEIIFWRDGVWRGGCNDLYE